MSKPKNMWKVGPGGIVLQIDINDSDTPALVWDSIKKNYSATYDCAIGTGELDCGAVLLTDEQLEWLDKHCKQVDEAIEYARKDDPRYGV